MLGKLLGSYKSENGIIDLGKVEVISKGITNIKESSLIFYSLDNVRYFKTRAFNNDGNIDFDNLVCRYIKFDYDLEIKLYKGEGYIGEVNKKWNKLFARSTMWTGGDGLYSFNIDGKDNYLSSEDDHSIMVFGDTFYCTLGHTSERLAPLAMPNNSYLEIDSLNIDKLTPTFNVNEDEKGHVIAYITPENDLRYEGTMASNLVNYSLGLLEANYLSSYNPKKNIEIEFDLLSEEYIDHLDIYNYFVDSKVPLDYENRGVKEMEIYLDGELFKTIKLKKADYELKGSNVNKIIIKRKFRKAKLIIPNKINVGNYKGVNNEALFGLNKVYFYKDNETYLKEIDVECNSEFAKKDKHAWFWLQDGIIVNNHLYSLPFVVTSDLTQPEGFQFRIEGISLTSTQINAGKIDFSLTEQRMTNLYTKKDGSTFTLGSCFFDNSFDSGEEKSDGYIYIYGYKSNPATSLEKGNSLIASRIKKEDFPNLNKLEFYSDGKYVSDITLASELLDHVSCEMSVHHDNGKYIAVFTLDVQSRYIAYSLADSPVGPFGEIRVAYVCPEDFCPHMYLYNAKAHPHLSKEGNILVSYNVNTSNFDENIKFGKTYGPRFLNLKKVGGNKR